ncbi:MAG: PEP-CTERM sorting domain-containing protein [Symploca sp. SIO2E6]|nr:PEP-CTERM sorting domain-containing protein [Symploca sp. SIO2E6]
MITATSTATASTLKITVENLMPTNGGVVTPFWFGLHDGSFNTFDLGAPASSGIEHVAEDGLTGLENTLPGNENFEINDFFQFDSTIADLFQNSNAGMNGGLQDLVTGENMPVLGIFPGEIGTATVNVDQQNISNNRFFSYASMFFPSNDAFIADDNPIEIFDSAGNFIGADLIVFGNQVWDAGTEVNDEDLSTVPFTLDSIAQGVEEGGVVTVHPGLQPVGSGGLLDFGNGAFANGDFTVDGFQVARITIAQVPEPATTVGLLVLGGLFFIRRRVAS